MLTPLPFFFVALAAATFALVSRVSGGGRGRRGFGRGRGRARRGRSGVSIWSFDALFLVVAGFGVGGFFAATARLGDAWTVAIGAASGVALAALDVGLMSALLAREGSSSHRAEQFLGATGVVEISISANGVGRVRCLRGAASEALLARSLGPGIAAGSTVRVTSVAGSVVVVEPVDPSEAHGPLAWRN